MGSSTSKQSKPPPSNPLQTVRDRVDEEIARRMMVQREVQLAVNLAKARDTIQIF